MRFSALPAAALLALAPSVTLAEDRVIAVTSPARDEVVPLNKPFIIQWSHPYGAFTGINAKFGLSGGPTNETMEDCGLIIAKVLDSPYGDNDVGNLQWDVSDYQPATGGEWICSEAWADRANNLFGVFMLMADEPDEHKHYSEPFKISASE